MRKHSEYFDVVLVVFVWGLASLFQPIFDHLVASSLLAWLENYMGVSEAEILARLSEIALPVTGSIFLILLLYRFLERELRREFKDEYARLKKRLVDLRAEGVVLRNRGQTTTVGVSDWIMKCMNWSRRVIETIEILSPADAEWFNTLDAVPEPRTPITDSNNIYQIKAYREHDFYLVKLERLLEKYS